MARSLKKGPFADASLLKDFIGEADYILVMSVHPGFGGQKFIPESVEKVGTVRRMIEDAGADCFIEVDGGVNVSNIGPLAEAGVSVFVAGSSAFVKGGSRDDRMKAVSALNKAAHSYC